MFEPDVVYFGGEYELPDPPVYTTAGAITDFFRFSLFIEISLSGSFIILEEYEGSGV